MSSIILLRGGGDLASGVALRLRRVGLRLVITELPQPLAVRRWVSFSEAVYEGQTQVEGIIGRLALGSEETFKILEAGEIPVLVDPPADARHVLKPLVLVDARMTKQPPDLDFDAAQLVIGLGPGFVPGENCHAAIETHRGHRLGRVLWQGAPEPDTGIPGKVGGQDENRVLRAPADGILQTYAEIGQTIQAEQVIAEVGGQSVIAPFTGMLRGLLRSELAIRKGMKIGDLDPRNDPEICSLVSEKSLAVGGGVLEAILSKPELRTKLWSPP